MDFGYKGFFLFDGIFTLIFLLAIGIFLVTAVQSIRVWNKNNHAPRLTIPATVVTKRTNVSRHRRAGKHHYTSTHYYATFQAESGDRMELSVTGAEYGLLAEGDQGELTFQGTRYVGFERKCNVN